MVSFLEREANKFARRNKDRYDEMTRKFERSSKKMTKKECDELHAKKTVICDDSARRVFADLSYLFERTNGVTLYDKLREDIENADSMTGFGAIYEDHLGDVYKKLTGKDFAGCKLLEKIRRTNKFVKGVIECVQYRMSYHKDCVQHATNYDVESHEHEILFRIFLYKVVAKVQKLLNHFRERCRGYRKEKKILLRKKEKALEREELVLETQRSVLEAQKAAMAAQFESQKAAIAAQFESQTSAIEKRLAQLDTELKEVHTKKETIQLETSSNDHFRSSTVESSSASALMSPDILPQPFSTKRKKDKRTQRRKGER